MALGSDSSSSCNLMQKLELGNYRELHICAERSPTELAERKILLPEWLSSELLTAVDRRSAELL